MLADVMEAKLNNTIDANNPYASLQVEAELQGRMLLLKELLFNSENAKVN